MEEQKPAQPVETESQDTSLLHKFGSKEEGLFTMKKLLILIAALVIGVGSGYMLAKKGGVASMTSGGAGEVTDSSSITKGTVVGSDDTKTFKDTAEGTLEEGGIEGEGQYHLVRPGGESQYVYLTSSIVDLSLFKGKKVKVWGQTNTAQTAGWLMDVGKVEVLE